MRYIRFLKPPRLQASTVKTLVTITSDLGDDFLATDHRLLVKLTSSAGRPITASKAQWKAGMRVLAIELQVPQDGIDDMASARAELTLHVSSAHTPDVLPGSPGGDAWPASHVLAARSAPFGGHHHISEPAADGRLAREFHLANGSHLRIWERPGDTIDGHVWDAAYALLSHLNHSLASHHHHHLLHLPSVAVVAAAAAAPTRRLSILELGTGTGIASLFLAATVPSATMTLTDLASAEPLARANMDAVTLAPDTRARFVALEWGADDALPRAVASTTYDAVILSDCTYNPDSAAALVRTMALVAAASPAVVVLVAAKRRHGAEAAFGAAMAAAGFSVEDAWRVRLPTEWDDGCLLVAGGGEVDDGEVELTLYQKPGPGGRGLAVDREYFVRLLWQR
jgi:hypothetical protein